MDALLGSTTIQLSATLCVLWISWRIWRFTIRPSLHPEEPKELPYWLPFIGHAAAFFQDFNAAVAKGRKHFGASGEPFVITVAGQTIYIATSPGDINDVWNKSKAIAMQPIADDMYISVGISEKSRKALFQVHEGAQYNGGVGKALNPTEMTNSIHQQTLRNGPGLDELTGTITIPAMSKKLDFAKTGDPNHPFTISLLDVCVDVFITNGTDAWFGPKLRELEPNLISAFEGWEYCNWKFLFQVPGIFAKDMLASKDTLTNAFTRYYELQRSERPGATVFVTALEDMLREVGLTEVEMGRYTLLHYWAIFGNVYKLAFWTVAHLVHNPILLQQIHEEVSCAVQGDDVDETYLLEQCPKLESLVNEALRWTVQSSLGRVVIEPTVIGGKLLRPGNKIMLPISALHSSLSTWDDPATFVPDRFIENPKLSKSSSFRPWGGGPTMCPGRFFARRMVNAFIALLVSRYELKVESEKFPEADGSRPSPGAILVAQGQDVKVRCTPRKR